MTDEPRTDEAPQTTGMPTARVADSYGANPNEHKPSQDAWDPDTADEKQAATGGVYVEGDTAWDGSNSSTSRSETNSSDAKTGGDSTPAPTTENPLKKDQTDSRSAGSTATARKAQSAKAGK